MNRKPGSLIDNGWIRFGIYTLDDVFFHIVGRECKERQKMFDGKLVNFGSTKLRTFRESPKCFYCGLYGLFFAMEKPRIPDPSNKREIWTFNLYSLTEQGKEVLMTVDHVVPHSQGGRCFHGKNFNLRTCCYVCNQLKGDKDPANLNLLHLVEESLKWQKELHQ